jgi:hypothetical protein
MVSKVPIRNVGLATFRCWRPGELACMLDKDLRDEAQCATDLEMREDTHANDN